MRSASLLRNLLGVAIALALLISLANAQDAPAGGQTGPPAGGGGQGQGGGQAGGIGNPQPGGTPDRGTGFPRPGQDRQPTDPRDPRQPGQFPEMQRAIYLSGKVVMEDGTPPPDQVVIERVCNGQPRPEGYTDSKGRFSFELGRNSAMMMDASVSSAADDFGGGRQGNRPFSMGGGGVTERDLMGCELRASLAGFRSDVVNLAGRRMMDNPDVGTIVLRRLAKVDGFTFSGTTAFAPKDARKAYEKSRDQIKKKKFADAEKELNKAVQIYPKFAIAWYELGLVYAAQNKLADAKNAYAESIKADSKLISPYGGLAKLALAENNWEEVATQTAQIIKLNPYYSPDAYFYSGVANFQLQKLDPAEEHTREAIKMDTKKRNPKLNHLLGLILAQKGQYPEAAENMRTYLKAVPDAKDADQVKQQLAQVEKAMGGAVAGAQAAQ